MPPRTRKSAARKPAGEARPPSHTGHGDATAAPQDPGSLAEALNRALAEAELLNAITTAAAGEDDLSHILTAALDQLWHVLHFTGGSIALVEGDELVVRAAIGPFAAHAIGQRQARGAGRSWRIVTEGEPLLSNDLAADGIKATNAFRSYLAVPLIWRGQGFGVLEIDSTETNAFTPADLALMCKVAAALSGSIELARRYTAEVRAVAVAEETQRRLAFLAEASTVLAASLDYETTLAQVARLAVPYLADGCAFFVLGADGQVQRVEMSYVNPQQEHLARELIARYPPQPGAATAIPKALQTGAAELVAEVTDALIAAAALDAEHLAILRAIGLTSYMVVPLRARERMLGLLMFASTESGRRYGDADLALAEDLARRAALAIDSARLYREAQDAVRMREVFLSVAAHELKTPLTSVLGFAELLERRALRDKSLKEREQKLLRIVVRQTQQINKLISAMLDLSRIEAGQFDIERGAVDLGALARRVVDEAQPTLDRHTVTFKGPPEPLVIAGDELRLEQVLQNLVRNAIKYSPSGGPVEVRVERDGDRARVAVSDHGIGIPQAAQARLFERFYRAGNVLDWHISGLGIGLHIVRTIVGLHGGEVTVASQEGQGSTFTVWLPLRDTDHRPPTTDHRPPTADR